MPLAFINTAFTESNRQADRQTDGQTDPRTDIATASLISQRLVNDFLLPILILSAAQTYLTIKYTATKTRVLNANTWHFFWDVGMRD